MQRQPASGARENVFSMSGRGRVGCSDSMSDEDAATPLQCNLRSANQRLPRPSVKRQMLTLAGDGSGSHDRVRRKEGSSTSLPT